LEAPEPRVALGKRLRGVAAAAIDVSDGLLADLGHVAAQSKLAAEIEYEAVPRAVSLTACPDRALADECLLAGGDDYELVFTASPDKRAEVEAAGQAAGVPVTRIGRMAAGAPGVRLLDRAGQPLPLGRLGFEHFG
jgi:thiamine-monophosphate kinase